jgi:hypothetical protein
VGGGSGADKKKQNVAETKLGKGVTADALTKDAEAQYASSLGDWKKQLEAEDEAKRKAAERAKVGGAGASATTSAGKAGATSPGIQPPPTVGRDGTANAPGQATYWDGSPMYDKAGKKNPLPPPPAPGSPQAAAYAASRNPQQGGGLPAPGGGPGASGGPLPIVEAYPGEYINTKEGRVHPAWVSGSYMPASSEASAQMDALYFKGRMSGKTTIDPKEGEDQRKRLGALKGGVGTRRSGGGTQAGNMGVMGSPVVRNDRRIYPSNEWGGWVNIQETPRVK